MNVHSGAQAIVGNVNKPACADDAPKNNKNALKHGFATREAIRERAEFRACIAEARQFLTDLESED